MTDETTDATDVHARQVEAIAAAVAKLLPRLAAQEFTPDAIFEGAVKGGAVALIATGTTAENVADLLDDMAAAFRDLEKPALTVVQ